MWDLQCPRERRTLEVQTSPNASRTRRYVEQNTTLITYVSQWWRLWKLGGNAGNWLQCDLEAFKNACVLIAGLLYSNNAFKHQYWATHVGWEHCFTRCFICFLSAKLNGAMSHILFLPLTAATGLRKLLGAAWAISSKRSHLGRHLGSCGGGRCAAANPHSPRGKLCIPGKRNLLVRYPVSGVCLAFCWRRNFLRSLRVWHLCSWPCFLSNVNICCRSGRCKVH